MHAACVQGRLPRDWQDVQSRFYVLWSAAAYTDTDFSVNNQAFRIMVFPKGNASYDGNVSVFLEQFGIADALAPEYGLTEAMSHSPSAYSYECFVHFHLYIVNQHSGEKVFRGEYFSESFCKAAQLDGLDIVAC